MYDVRSEEEEEEEGAGEMEVMAPHPRSIFSILCADAVFQMTTDPSSEADKTCLLSSLQTRSQIGREWDPVRDRAMPRVAHDQR